MSATPATNSTAIESPFIDDDYTCTGYVAKQDGLYPEMRFTYRPTLEEQNKKLDQLLKQTPDEEDKCRKLNEIIIKQIIDWGHTNVAINAKNFSRIRPLLKMHMVDIIQGYRSSDIDPKSNEPAKPTTSTEQLQESAKN